ncbi:MAG: ATP-binding cassette domain-containing protein [Enterobacterales bacterium]|nr:ATP-binding cassette domain-containing protein [Enterobacterales bacterium]
MSLIRGDHLSLSYGPQVLLDNTSFVIEQGQKVCLIGRNGTGKSTLLKMINGEVMADDGIINRSNQVTVAFLNQALPEKNQLTIRQYVASGLSHVIEAVEAYQKLIMEDCQSPKLEALDQIINAQDGWAAEQRIEQTLSRLALDGDQVMESLSGGWRRRAALAKALVQNPDLLILDEPTNHLDLTSIQWLEEQLIKFRGALLFVSHDRHFVNKVADQIMELDRGHLRLYPGNYQRYLEIKAQQLRDEEKTNAEFDKRLVKEEKWIRQGIKARRTRNEGRVRALKKMRQEHAARRDKIGNSLFNANVAKQNSKIVATMDKLVVGYKEALITPLDYIIQKGDKIGILGDNGSGKTTFIKTLLGQLPALSGSFQASENIKVAYFDQLRDGIDLQKTVSDNLTDGKDFVIIDGNERHVISYMADFNFTPDRVRAPAHSLSGGEINRLLLAKLFTQAANLFVLDEPTNDLDVETLEILEQMLVEISATVIVISHDRAFLDNCCSELLVFDNQLLSQVEKQQGLFKVIEISGGYQDWKCYLAQQLAELEKSQRSQPAAKTKIQQRIEKPSQKRSYSEQKRLEELPKLIESLENEVADFETIMAQPEFYQQREKSDKVLKEFDKVQADLGALYTEWDGLEG